MQIPNILYHGAFLIDGTELDPDGFKSSFGYVSTTPYIDWAKYFAWSQRGKVLNQPGNLTIFELDKEKIPQEILQKALPPDGIDPRAFESTDDSIFERECALLFERKKFREWRFPSIPLEALVVFSEEHINRYGVETYTGPMKFPED